MIITLVWTNNYRRNHVLESVLEIWTVEAGLLDTNITALWIAGGFTEVLSVLLTQPRAVSLVCLVIYIIGITYKLIKMHLGTYVREDPVFLKYK